MFTVHIPSQAAVERSNLMASKSIVQNVIDFLEKPKLPYGKNVVIHKITSTNYDHIQGSHMGKFTYGDFRKLNSEDFPEFKEDGDYLDEEQVSPITLFLSIEEDKEIVEYQAPQLLWFVLTDIISGIIPKQSRLGKKLLPISVFLDLKNQFICDLANLAGMAPSKEISHKTTEIHVGRNEKCPCKSGKKFKKCCMTKI